MKTYKVFLLEDGTLRSIFHFFYFKKGKNCIDEGTRGFLSWKKEADAERYRDTLVARFFYKVVIKEVTVEDVIKEVKERLYTKEAKKKLKIKNKKKLYGIAIYSKTLYIV